MRHVVFLVAVAVVLTCTGCASIVSKSAYPVTFTSTPSGATFTVKNDKGIEVHRAVTPSTLTLPAGAGYFKAASYTISFEKEGCSPATASLKADLDPWYFGNILLGGLIGMIIVDPITGAMWKLDDYVSVGLPETGAKPSAGHAERTADVPSSAAPSASENEPSPQAKHTE
jgi:uncharacterized protein YceK